MVTKRHLLGYAINKKKRKGKSHLFSVNGNQVNDKTGIKLIDGFC